MLESMQKSWINPEKQLLQKFRDLQLVTFMEVEMASLPTSDFIRVVVGEITTQKNFEKCSGSTHQITHELVHIKQYHALSGCTSVIDPTKNPITQNYPTFV